MPLIPQIVLHDKTTIPAIGFGTYKLNGAEGVDAIARAISNGYRLLDSAFNYENEGTVGQAVLRAEVAREDLRITSKLPGRHHSFAQALSTVEESLYRAQLDYYDLYLIHWPNPKRGLYIEAWQALIEAQKRGLVLSIGVCNFLPEHLDALQMQTGVMPSVNQIELHPYFPQEEQLAYDRQHGIATESWSPLGRQGTLLHEPIVLELAAALGRSAAQVILRWHHQLGAIPIPKANSNALQLENLDIFDFELDHGAMQQIRGLAKPEGRLNHQDPAVYEEF